MLVAYLTTDEVNQELAVQMAEDCGVTLYLLSLHEAPPNGQFNAVLYDWDCLPLQWRREVLAELLLGRPPHSLALHSYSLDDKHVEALDVNGVAVFQRLEPEVFLTLCLKEFPRREQGSHGGG